ncbi:hypothetical protein ABID21_001962 [Pseudorhizobium tarimense]|uniref:Uncharacterized protein n=1 Tax=Pseudorhizobium tarimense TaxID=1079109 RepID=A0ABV2H5M8_9HYPH
MQPLPAPADTNIHDGRVLSTSLVIYAISNESEWRRIPLLMLRSQQLSSRRRGAMSRFMTVIPLIGFCTFVANDAGWLSIVSLGFGDQSGTR